MTPEGYLTELQMALDEYRFEDIRSLTNQIIPAEFNDNQVKKTLGMIRRKRLFSELEKAASLFFLAGKQASVVRRQWAQALLDQNRVPQALTALQMIADEVKDDPIEGPEVRGLIGRAYKQLFINEGGKENLRKAINAYRQGWQARKGDYRWHGINLVALLARAERDGVDPGVDDRKAEIARQILGEIEALGQNAGVWDYGTGMEASVALGDHEEALKWAGKYARHPDADAFELASTLCQMKGVWNLEGTKIGIKLLPVLEYELLQRESGTIEPAYSKVTDIRGFEAVYGSESYTYVDWMDTMYKCCGGVARVHQTSTGRPWGTGFLVKGSLLRKDWGIGPVFVTNSHVISDNPADEALSPSDGSVVFTRLEKRPNVKLGNLLFTSPRIELDVSVLSIRSPKKGFPLEPTIDPPPLTKRKERPQRIYVMGHPWGGELAVSLYDNSLVGYQKNRYAHYRSPTDQGHSGSPVFSLDWKLFAIHHKARPDRKVNEGVLFRAIKEAISS